MDDKDLTLLDTIQELTEHVPFEPFRLLTTSGDKYMVERPRNLAIGASQLFYCYPGSDRLVYIRINQLVAIEKFGEKSAA